MVGGKQIEVMGTISNEDFVKGRCFQENLLETPAVKEPVKNQYAKPFIKPTRATDSCLKVSDPEATVYKPRHDPTSPGTHKRTTLQALKFFFFN